MTSDNIIAIGDCEIHHSSQIKSGSIIGKPYRLFLDREQEELLKTYISENVYIGYYAIVGNGSVIEPNVIIDDYSLIESRVTIKERSLIIYRAQICCDAVIGRDCVIGGLVGERTIVGDKCRIFGKVIHSHHNLALGWDDDEAGENSPVIEEGVFIGFNSLVIGNISIGKDAYISAGSIVTKSVPARHIVSGRNKRTPIPDGWNHQVLIPPPTTA